ncbi:MAG: AAA-like domain-containing protein [Cyanobacteriota bacterium]|nr:AAA-like domain-containing protein [Cyanobacteriota bacterium]
MNCEEALTVADAAVYNKTGTHLSDLECTVLEMICQDCEYLDIAVSTSYSPTYIEKDVGPKLWRKLSEALGEKVKKKNFRKALERYARARNASSLVLEQEFPNRPLAQNSNLYIKRSPIEEICYQEILKPGSLIRIKGPGKMGKTSLLHQILQHAEGEGYRTVRVRFQNMESATFDNFDKFLKQFSANVAKALGLEPEIDRFWDEELFGNVSNCTTYFQGYLFEKVKTPLVLALDEFERLFEHEKIAKDFFALLRSWHEEPNNLDIWQKLRLVVVHSTEPYIEFDINKSPFNVGLPIQLPEFELEQVQELARRCGLHWTTSSQAERLRVMLGGHPYLWQLAFYYLRRGDLQLEDLLEKAPTQEGIYGDHLRDLSELVNRSPLREAFRQVLETNEGTQLEPNLAYQLERLGIVRIEKNHVRVTCELYRRYFCNNLFNSY